MVLPSCLGVISLIVCMSHKRDVVFVIPSSPDFQLSQSTFGGVKDPVTTTTQCHSIHRIFLFVKMVSPQRGFKEVSTDHTNLEPPMRPCSFHAISDERFSGLLSYCSVLCLVFCEFAPTVGIATSFVSWILFQLLADRAYLTLDHSNPMNDH